MSSEKEQLSERLSIGFKPDQIRRMDELIRTRARKGNLLSKSDLIRASLEFYLMHQEDLPGSRKAVAKSVEAKLAQVETKVDQLTVRLNSFIDYLNARIRK
jgi:hypothetical protein